MPVRANAVIGMDPNNTYVPGSEMSMGCAVQGFPVPTVTWLKDGYPIIANDRIEITNGSE